MKWFSKIKELAGQEYERYLPTAFDGSLTLLEKVNKVIETLNQIVLGVNTVADYVDEHVDTQYEKIKQLRDDFEILKDWLENEGLEERTELVLNEWFDNGRLAQIINNDVFNMKADKATFEQFVVSTNQQLEQTADKTIFEQFVVSTNQQLEQTNVELNKKATMVKSEATPILVPGSSGEVEISSYIIRGGELGTDGGLEYNVSGRLYNGYGPETDYTLRIKLGDNILLELDDIHFTPSTVGSLGFQLTGLLVNSGVNSQRLMGRFSLSEMGQEKLLPVRDNYITRANVESDVNTGVDQKFSITIEPSIHNKDINIVRDISFMKFTGRG